MSSECAAVCPFTHLAEVRRCVTSSDCACLQMLTFTQHPYMLLSSKALPLWIALLSPRDNAAKQEAHPPNLSHSLLPLECVSALLDLAGMQVSCHSVQ